MPRRPWVPVVLAAALAAAAAAVRRRTGPVSAPGEGTGFHRGPVANRPVMTGPVQGRPRSYAQLAREIDDSKQQIADLVPEPFSSG